MDNMENNDNRNHREYGPFDYLLSFIFIIWLVGSVIGIIYCFNHEKDAIGVTLVGGIFLVFGLIIVGQGIYYQNFVPITLIFPLIGTGLIIFGLIYYFDNERLKYIAEKSLPNLLLMFFTAVGTGMIIGGIKLYQNQVDNCSYVTMATCVKVRNKTYHGTPVQCPVFQIELEGKTMVICNRCYTNTNKISQGDVVELHVNPNRPKEYYIEKRKDNSGIGLALFGGLIVGMMALIFYIVNFIA